MSRYFTKTLASLEPYTPGEQLKIADIVKLNANENPYPPAPGVAAAVEAAVPGLRLYSDLSNRALNEAIAAHWGVQPENILCGNGSDENLLLALRAFCDENTPLAFADVTYSFYPVLCDLLHIPQHVIPLEDDLTIDLKKYCGLHETIVIANPNAPTSLLAPVAAIEEVLRTNPDNIVVVDETYVEFAPAGSSCLPLLEKYENLVITHTFSKTHNLAGARLGYCIARPGLITDMNRVKFGYSPYNVNSMTQAAGVAAMLHDIAKPLSLPEMQKKAQEYDMRLPKDIYADENLLHGPLAAAIAEHELGVTDAEILSAIACHTTGKPDMTVLEQVIYLADAIEPNRRDYPGLAQIRALAQTNLSAAVLLSMRRTREYVLSQGHAFCPQTELAMQSLAAKEETK